MNKNIIGIKYCLCLYFDTHFHRRISTRATKEAVEKYKNTLKPAPYGYTYEIRGEGGIPAGE